MIERSRVSLRSTRATDLPSHLDPQQLRRRAPENVRLLIIAERGRRKDVVDRRKLPGERIVAAEHELARAYLRRQMAQRFGGEHQRIEIDLLEIFGRLLCQLDLGVASFGVDQAGVVGAVGVGGKEPAAMGGDHLEPREAVEGALEDQMRQRDRGLDGIGDGIGEPAVAGERLVEFGNALRMDEQRRALEALLALTF